MNLVLASSSPFRQALLERLGLPFRCYTSDIDETPLLGELPETLVSRLAKLKAQAAHQAFPNAVCIGCDTLAFIDQQELGKPLNYENAVAQLNQMSGQKVVFLTAVCVSTQHNPLCLCEVVPTEVKFRSLNESTIKAYLDKEHPFYSSGTFKSETSACALIESQKSDDPTAIIGLPMIRLCHMLEQAGIKILGS